MQYLNSGPERVQCDHYPRPTDLLLNQKVYTAYWADGYRPFTWART